MFLTLSSTCVQKFSYRHPPFVFLSHSVAVAALSETRRYGASVHFGVVVVELINCKCGEIERNQIW